MGIVPVSIVDLILNPALASDATQIREGTANTIVAGVQLVDRMKMTEEIKSLSWSLKC